MSEDRSFSSAKLREFVQDELQAKENTDLYPHTGIVEPGSTTEELLSFVESVYDPSDRDLPPRFENTRMAQVLRRRAATEYIGDQIPDVASFAVGLTDRDVEVSEAQALARIANSMRGECQCSCPIVYVIHQLQNNLIFCFSRRDTAPS